MKAYSLDLRQKIIDVYQNESISQRQLAQRFDVTKSFVIKLLKQHRETGDIKDEAGVNLALVRLYARAAKGKRARGARPQKRGKNVSMIGAVALKGIVASVNVYGSSDRITFEAFVVNKLVPRLWKGACVILDNSTIHKGDEIRAAIETVGAKLIFLSPYSPEFNPLENLWSKLKNTLRSIQARTYQALDEAIAIAYAQISLDNIRNWFTHCCYCTSSK